MGWHMTKQIRFLLLFFVVQLFLVFFQIHKNSTLVKYSYAKQRNEKLRAELIEEKNALNHALQTLKSRANIKDEAELKGMTPVRLDRIKRIDELHDKPVQVKT
jgi:regulatory protein YycI of two-component signal transduction system YycFG